MKRENIEEVYKWDLEKFCKDKEELDGWKNSVENLLVEIKNLKGKLSTSFEILLKALELKEEISRIGSNIYVYSHLRRDEDHNNSDNQKTSLESDKLMNDIDEATSYIIPEILSFEFNHITQIFEEENLKKYHRYLEKIIRKKPHTLSEKEENLLAMSGNMAQATENIFTSLSYSDLKFPKIKNKDGEKERLTHSNYGLFLRSKKRKVRKDAFEAMYDTHEKVKNTFGSCLIGNIHREIFFSKVRNYNSALEASLFEDDIPVSVYDNLIESITENISSLDLYMEYRKNIMGLEKLHMYDLYVPLNSKMDKKIPYEEAKRIILEALSPLGEEYTKILKTAFEERWIDVYPNEGKRSGAYSWGSYDSQPYILMNYNDDINSLFTLAHELGHSIHSYYSRKNNPYIYSRYTIFVAEVASTFNELMVLNYLLENTESEEEKSYLINYYLEQVRTTVFRQTMFAEFEKEVHARIEDGKSLTSKDLEEIYYALNMKYYGNKCEVDERISLEWARIPHFYSNFYVYKYATGFCAANFLTEKVRENRENVDAYIEFLKGGGYDFPLEQLKKAGVNMEEKEVVLKTMNLFKERLEGMLMV